MTSKILISSEVCRDDVVRYLASRYRCRPEEIINRFIEQEGYLPPRGGQPSPPLETNEVEILRDMHIGPTEIEFV